MSTKIIFILTILFLIPGPIFGQSDEVVIFHTKSGKLVIEFFPEDAPNTVDNFLKLAKSSFYDRTIFHRIIKDFMIQGGDPLTKPGAYQHVSQWGTGDAGYTIPAEFNTIKHNRGIVSMARGTDPNSASSQFFIVHQDSNFLDGQYTAFGRLVTQESYETLDKIASLETAPNDIAFKWGEGEILRTEVVSRSQVPDLMEMSPPERMEKSGGVIFGLQYSNKKLGFSFNAPEGWLVQEPPKTNSNTPTVVALGPKITGVVPPAIYVTVTDAEGKSLNDYINEVKDSIQSDDDEGVIFSEKETKVGERNGYEITTLQAFKTGSGAIVNMKLTSVIISAQDKFYAIAYSNTEDNFDSNLYRFDEVLNSFTLLSTETESSNGEQTAPTNDSQTNNGGCLIATAAFGSELSPQVQMLREIRDNTVYSTQSGTSFMTAFNAFYYSFSPTVADLERQNPAFKEAVKLTITPLISSLTLLQYADIDTEGEMLGYGVGIILLNIGMYLGIPVIITLKIRQKIKNL